MPMSSFSYTPLLPYGADETDYELVTNEHVTQIEIDGETFIKVAPEGLRLLSERAFKDISHLLRPAHLGQLRALAATCQTATIDIACIHPGPISQILAATP